MKRFKFKINNSGFTLIEVMVAMTVVMVVAAFAATAITANGKSLTATQALSKGGDGSLSECEKYLANDAEHGKTEGDLQLKKVDGGLNGFPDITLEIKDSLDTPAEMGEAEVKYVAFKRLGNEDENAAGGGGVSASGGGVTSGESGGSESGSGDGSASGSSGGGSSDANTEEEPQEPEKVVTEAPTEAPTQPVTEPQTEAPTQPATEAATEAATESSTQQQITPSSGNVYFDNITMQNIATKVDWGWYAGYNFNGNTMKNEDGITARLAYSLVSEIDSNGMLVKGSNDCFQMNDIYDDSWNFVYGVTIYLSSSKGGNPNCKVNDVVVTEQAYTIPYEAWRKGGFKVTANDDEGVYIKGISIYKAE